MSNSIYSALEKLLQLKLALIFAPGTVAIISGEQAMQAALTEDEAVALALKANPRTQAALLNIDAARWGVRSARALSNPTIQVTPGFTRAGSDEELLISQPLEINGTRAARTGIASARFRGAAANATLEIRDLIYETRLAFQEAVRSQDRAVLAKDLLKYAEDLDRFAQRQVELGSRPGIERTQTSIEARRARQAAALADAESQSALGKLRTLIGQQADSPLQLAPIVFVSITPNKEHLVQQALEGRPEIALTKANRDASRQEARLARAEGIPDLAPQFRADSITREPRTSGFGVAITISLLDFGERHGRIRQAQSSARSEESRLSALSAQIRQEVEQAVARLRAADAVIQEFRAGLLDDARKLFESTRTGFQLGQTTIAALLEAQRTFRSVETEYIDALVSYARARAELERATGALPMEISSGPRKPQVQLR